MVRFKIPGATVLLWLLVLVVTAGAETWYLGQGEQWKELPEECRDAFVKANEFFNQGKLIKAARLYGKFLADCDSASELYDEVLQRQFSIARKFLSGYKRRFLGILKLTTYAEGVKIMEKIAEHAGKRQVGIDAVAELAIYYEQKAKYNPTYYELAYLKWRQLFEGYDHQARISKAYPTGELGKDALLGMARCKELTYRGPKYSISDLVGRPVTASIYDNAKGCYEQFKLLYPEDAARLNIDAKIAQIEQEAAMKDLNIANYYQKTGNKLSANLYYQMVLRNWPQTEAARMAKEALSKNLLIQEN